ncbi:ATP-binding cassette domain-containing protein [Fodinisporobacter ferrooxydans]|uniref:ATP-binding cassette domain-containing protein n=1 Tax=Fodinisporobacter ferrooxydans TaxID=2901836 RepID=A0ABY4CQ51_9BACL|nr:ATP-binding cassette domain-containing protein [Alicyclobacillaceae bacterium MYW30-H2]
MNNHPILELQNVSVVYRQRNGLHTSLHEIGLQIGQGEWLAIAGRNGSGKSTLAKVIAGLCPISKGTITKQADLGHISMVFQNPDSQLIGETIFEDLCFSMENFQVDPNDMEIRAREALQQVGLAMDIHWEVSRLSGGQKQLLNIAGCLVTGANLFLFDESTSMLDPLARERMLQVVRTLHKAGRTIVWITQWMEELAWADRVIVLEDGRIKFSGCPRKFFYGVSNQTEWSPCEQFRFPPPYVVQVARLLQQKGIDIPKGPLTVEEFQQMCGAICQSV